MNLFLIYDRNQHKNKEIYKKIHTVDNILMLIGVFFFFIVYISYLLSRHFKVSLIVHSSPFMFIKLCPAQLVGSVEYTDCISADG